MQTNKFSKKMILIIIGILMSASLLVAAIIDSDTFDSNTEGWTGTGVSWDSTYKRLKILRGATATKVFDLGIANAGMSFKVSLGATRTTNWESSTDRIVITSNSTVVWDSYTAGTIGFNTVADANGKITLTIKANSDKAGEDLYIDNINTDDAPDLKEKEFARKVIFNMQGNMKTIGNTVLCPKDSSGQCIETTLRNNYADLKYVDIDGKVTNTTFNSSSATLVDSAITTADTAKVKWAGLYWSGYVHDYTKINDNIKFTENGVTHDIAPDEKLGHSKYSSFNRYSYGNYANVTKFLQEKDPSGIYTVANIPSEEGKTSDDGDGLGNSGAWTLVVIYENKSLGEKIRNITVFDGFKAITNISPNNKVDILVDGFKTPKSGNVDSTLSVFANEGDKYITGDYFELKDQTGAISKKLPDTGNFFDSSITGIDTRNPKVTNNNGIDIHTNQVGIGSAGSLDVIGLDQTSATITLGSTGDYYFPVMVAFATELQITELCYDYSVRINDQAMQKGTSDRQYNAGAFDSGSIDSKIFIRSLEGDFDFENTTLRASWNKIPKDASDTSTPSFTFDNSKSAIQPSNQYQWIPSTQRSMAPTDGAISIGGINYDDPDGGVLLRQQSTYASINHQAADIKPSDILELNIDVNFDIYFDSTVPTNYTVGTQSGSLKLCPGTPVYSPEWLEFNIEHGGANVGEYGLDTEVTGRAFDAQIAAYDPTNPNVRKAVPVSVGLEVELIELPTFDSFTTYSATNTYDRICQDSSIFKPWLNSSGSDTEKRFTLFNAGDITRPFPVSATQNRFALRNSALRVWALETGPIGSRVLKTHDCTDFKDGRDCFKDLYAKDTFYQGEAKCGVCTTGTEEDCYTCLKRYYGKPFCSRDNFSIRPDAIRLEVSDLSPTTRTLDVNDIGMKTSTIKPMTLVANHPNYGVGLQARKRNSTANALGYYIYDVVNTELAYETILPANRWKQDRFFGLLFDSATAKDSVISKCADTTHSNLKYNIVNGASQFPWQVKKANVGKYNLFLVDNDWTIVDQARYIYKTDLGTAKTDDCFPFSTDSPDSGKPGCTVSSEKQKKDSNNDFKLMPISFAPDSFDLASIARGNTDGTSKNWEYMNHLDKVEPREEKDKNASVMFTGSVIANGVDNVRASNFTAGCAATDVKIYMDFNTTSATAIMRGVLVGTDNSVDPQDVDSTIAKAFTISKDRFADTDVGAANIDMRYNISKLYNAALNPVEVVFKKLFAKATDRNITKDGVDTYQPAGERTLGDQIAFIYGRVYTTFMDSIRSVTTATTNMTLSVLGYCDTDCDKYSQAPYSAFEENPADTTKSKSTIPSWFKMVGHDPLNGQIDSITMNDSIAMNNSPAKIDNENPMGNSQFATNGATDEMILSFPMPSRDRLVEYTVNPSPWLLYSPIAADNGTPKFSIDWINPGAIWTGKGQTGNVVNMNANPDSKRLSW